ncbi:extracellular solute-binding protein [Bradyrhizobium sp. NBAIM01]|uniref:extracellular solute-binding protein n=1 Tax=Bradyrhizobium sp. NBAIM01 TaxID=2793818 RepID=UPI001CD33144|nr:extracellular solute-binding protein [Bradyrhizobium sp. NBAIM01]MCA1510391.1 extracellular solute-binding protein [Bradyrhizobium sp. NBAIM01]
MTKRNVAGNQVRGLNRRSLIQSTAALLSVPFVATATSAGAQEKLAGSGEVVVFSYGGSFTDGVRRAVYEPFTKATGIKVVDVVADFCEPQLKAMYSAGRMDWDVAFPDARNYPELRETGMFEPIDYSLWDQESLDGTPADARLKDAFVAGQTTIVIISDERVFKGKGPKNWVEFWDVKNFPGHRGLAGTVQGQQNILAALVADGVSPKDIWPMTDDKLDRAFKKLSELKPQISKWWTAGGEPVQLLLNNEYAMSSTYNNRAVQAIQKGAPIKMSYDNCYHTRTFGTLMKGGPNISNGQKFVAFLNRAPIAAAWTQGTGWPGSNVNQLKYLPADLAELSSVNPQNFSKVIVEDSDWLAAKRPDEKTNLAHVQERWLAWRAQ